jgi:hypothetical protein
VDAFNDFPGRILAIAVSCDAVSEAMMKFGSSQSNRCLLMMNDILNRGSQF